MRASRNARPSGGSSNTDLVRTPGLPVKHGHHWHTGTRSNACAAHEARVASSDTTAYMELAASVGAGYEAAAQALKLARRAVHGTGACAFDAALVALGA